MTNEQFKTLAEIEQLLAACTQAGDARKADAYAACYAPDGVLQLDEAIEGREAIRQWMAAPSVIPQPASGVPGYISHHLTTSRIDVTGLDSATGRIYWLVTSAAGLDHNGYYVDRYRRIDGQWLIERREPRTLWMSPDSVMRARMSG